MFDIPVLLVFIRVLYRNRTHRICTCMIINKNLLHWLTGTEWDNPTYLSADWRMGGAVHCSKKLEVSEQEGPMIQLSSEAEGLDIP